MAHFGLDERIMLPNRRNDILTVGELLVDMISTDYDADHESFQYQKFFGGSPSNIALNARKLGVRTLVAASVGEDGFGKFLIDRLRNAGIGTDCVQAVDVSTSLVVVNKSQSTPIPIFYRGADYHLGYNAQLEEALFNSNIVHFSCWPISRLPARHTIERVVESAKKHGAIIGFDPNYHPMIWQRGEDGVAYVKAMIAKADIVKPSEDDAERLFGQDTPARQIEKFLKLGAKLVILTLGKDGAIVSNGKETISFGTRATEVVDTTGAGDAFWSGFYAAVVKGYTIRESLSLGFAVSAYKLRFTGAIVDLPELEAIKDMYGVQEEWI